MPDNLVHLQSRQADEPLAERSPVAHTLPPIAVASRALKVLAFSATALAAIGLVFWLSRPQRSEPNVPRRSLSAARLHRTRHRAPSSTEPGKPR